LKKANRFKESETLLRSALKLRERLAADQSHNPAHKQGLADSRYHLAALFSRLRGMREEDEASYREALRVQESLVAGSRDRPEFRGKLARYLNNLGILQDASDPDAAAATFEQAMKIQDSLQAESANNASFRWQRARTWNNMANVLFRSTLAKEATPYYLKARDAFQSLATDFPKVPDYRRELAMALNNLGEVLEIAPTDLGKPLDLFRKALEDQKRLVDEFPEVPDHRLKLAITYLHIGEFFRHTTPAEAATPLLEAVKIEEKLVGEYPQVPEYQSNLGLSLTELARLLVDQRQDAEAVERFSKAIECFEKAREENPRQVSYVTHLVNAHIGRARALIKLSRHADLAREADEIGRIDRNRPDGPILSAGFYARASEIVGNDPSLPDPRRQEQKEAYARQALDAIQTAIDRGANNPAVLDGPDFKPLQNNPDFQKLRERWKAKGQKATV